MALDLAEVTHVPSLDAIMRLENAMREHPAQVHLEPKHHFAPGIYMRELFVPRGTLLTGKIHKTEHLSILAQGELTVWTENGMKRLKAPAVIHSMPGAKRVGLAHEDSTWICVHKTDETDLEKLEAELITPDNLLENVSFPG